MLDGPIRSQVNPSSLTMDSSRLSDMNPLVSLLVLRLGMHPFYTPDTRLRLPWRLGIQYVSLLILISDCGLIKLRAVGIQGV